MSPTRRQPARTEDARPLSEQAYDLLEQRIVTLALPPGQVVSEAGLAALSGFGRTPIREAVKALAWEGLVTVLPKRGIMISELNVGKQLDLLDARREIERYVASTAARRASRDERVAMVRIAGAMEAAGAADDGETFMHLDKAFHQGLLNCARNQYASAMMRVVQGQSRRFFFAYYQATTTVQETARLHADVARAVGQGDVDAARVAFDRLMDNVSAFTRATLDTA